MSVSSGDNRPSLDISNFNVHSSDDIESPRKKRAASIASTESSTSTVSAELSAISQANVRSPVKSNFVERDFSDLTMEVSQDLANMIDEVRFSTVQKLEAAKKAEVTVEKAKTNRNRAAIVTLIALVAIAIVSAATLGAAPALFFIISGVIAAVSLFVLIGFEVQRRQSLGVIKNAGDTRYINNSVNELLSKLNLNKVVEPELAIAFTGIAKSCAGISRLLIKREDINSALLKDKENEDLKKQLSGVNNQLIKTKDDLFKCLKNLENIQEQDQIDIGAHWFGENSREPFVGQFGHYESPRKAEAELNQELYDAQAVPVDQAALFHANGRTTPPFDNTDKLSTEGISLESYQNLGGEYECAVASFSGKKNEDRHIVDTFEVDGKSVLLCGVFDGHDGNVVSQFLKDHLSRHVQEQLREHLKDVPIVRDEIRKMQIQNAIKRAIVNLNNDLRKTGLENSGSTANGVIITEGEIWTFNVGNSRTIASLLNGPSNITLDSKPTSIGDFNVEGVSCLPGVTMINDKVIGEDGFIGIGTHGVFEVASTRGIVDYGKEKSADTIAKDVIAHSKNILEKEKKDDGITFIVLKPIRPNERPNDERHSRDYEHIIRSLSS